MVKSRGILPPKRWWTPEEEAYMREHYADTATEEIARVFGCKETRVLVKANKMHIFKSREFIAQVARERSNAPGHPSQAFRFSKGIVPANKGMKHEPGWSPGRMAESQFKPGTKPHTWVPVGSYRVVKNKNGGPELQRKVNDLPGPTYVRWKPVARLVWEAVHGPVPEGRIVVFKQGRKTTVLERITLDAVECITRLQLMQRNSIHTNCPPEIAEIARLRGVLHRHINRKTKDQAA
jgi:hypothetical protein